MITLYYLQANDLVLLDEVDGYAERAEVANSKRKKKI